MALSNHFCSNQEVASNDTCIPSGLLKVEESISTRLGACGFHSNDLILKVLFCINCSDISSCPGHLYVTTERIFFIANAAFLDFGKYDRFNITMRFNIYLHCFVFLTHIYF